MLKTILFCAILAYLSGVEADIGIGRVAGIKYWSSDESDWWIETESGDVYGWWVDSTGFSYFYVDHGHIGINDADGYWGILLGNITDGTYIFLTEYGIYKSRDINGWFSFFEGGSFGFDGETPKVTKGNKKQPLVIDIQKTGDKLVITPVTSEGYTNENQILNGSPQKVKTNNVGKKIKAVAFLAGNDEADKTEETTTPEYSVRRRSRYRGKSFGAETETAIETTTPEYSVRRRSGYREKILDEDETTTPEYSVRRRAFKRKSFGGTEIILPEPETTTPEYSVRRRFIKRA